MTNGWRNSIPCQRLTRAVAYASASPQPVHGSLRGSGAVAPSLAGQRLQTHHHEASDDGDVLEELFSWLLNVAASAS